MQIPEENAKKFVTEIDKAPMQEKIAILKVYLQAKGVQLRDADAVFYTKFEHGKMLVQRFAFIYDNYAIMISLIGTKVVKGIIRLDQEGLKLINELFSHEEEEPNEKH
ncbi:hypothetical protein [Sulfolobus polyhedral virus 1]|uniref:Uncharacterized protein n=1 Tax=Sulfolobus polyhedral virus 1 TaxID=1982658 RepID=A0A1W6I146_SPV1|nr:hypothetical protein DT302_gp08 [Sulfolobus polyhedral virus 1]ARM37790.1 hypothetical protein [Sulfolobus polyhedral virus 1]